MNKQKINGASWCEDAGLFFQLWQMLLLVVGAYQPFTEPPHIQHKAFLVARSEFGLESILFKVLTRHLNPNASEILSQYLC